MIGVAMYTTIKTLWEKHKNKSMIARVTGHDWKTVAKVIKRIEQGRAYPRKKPHPRFLDPYQESIIRWMEEGLSAVRMHEELQGMGLKVGYSTVKDYIKDIRKSITADLKTTANPIYLVGKNTEKEMGGSEYYNILKKQDGKVPSVDTKTLKNCIKGILESIEKEQIASCHDCSEGGIAITIAEMTIGGDIGCEIDLSKIGKDLRSDYKLFSETNTRWLIEVKEEKQTKEVSQQMIMVGQKAPDFTAPAYYKGKFVNIKLSEYLGKWVLLCFYPGDFTFV